MLYWAEGDKVSKNSFRIVNSDPKVIKLFVNFLEKICSIRSEKIKASLFLYPDHNEVECVRYWQEQAGIDHLKFNKTQRILGRSGYRKTPAGVCSISVPSSYLKKKMVVWFNKLPAMMLEDSYYLRA